MNINYFTIPVCMTLLFLITTVSCTPESDRLFVGEPEVITEGFRFTEGPYWHNDGYLLFSDIPANIVYKWTPGNPESEVYLEPSGNSNGIKALPDGTLLLAQHAGRVSQLSDDMELTTIADEYNGMRLNSPNDIAVRSDGLVYFTDPPFGVSDEDKELEFSGVYRINHDGTLTVIYDGFNYPNGIVFSPDEKHLYVNDSETGNIIRFDVLENGDVENRTLFANIGAMGELGGADGMQTDTDGRLYTTGPNGFIIYNSDGIQIHQLRFDHQITNLAWGGEDLNHLFITAPNKLYRVELNSIGWKVD